MKYWDIIAAPDAGTEKLVAWVEFCITRKKAIEGKKIKVRFVTRKSDFSQKENDYDYSEIPF